VETSAVLDSFIKAIIIYSYRVSDGCVCVCSIVRDAHMNVGNSRPDSGFKFREHGRITTTSPST